MDRNSLEGNMAAAASAECAAGGMGSSGFAAMHPPGTMYVGPYTLGPTLGRGTTGKVKVCTHQKTKRVNAVKIIQKAALDAHPDARKRMEREISILKQLRHPNVMRIHDILQTDTHWFVVLEYLGPVKYLPNAVSVEELAAEGGCGGGELFDFLLSKGFLPPDEAFAIFVQLFMGVEYLHTLNICHRDLKLENLLLDSRKTIKIADFGMAETMPSDGMLRTSCGSPHYACPEIVKGEIYHGVHADVWSMGVILFALCTGSLPFDNENIRELFEQIKGAVYRYPRALPPEITSLIDNILRVVGSERITFAGMRNSPWFAQNLPRLPSHLSQAWRQHHATITGIRRGSNSGM